MRLKDIAPRDLPSLPLWERGLKWVRFKNICLRRIVAPLVGAWIEIRDGGAELVRYHVAPLVGAWIEIRLTVVVEN